MKLIRIILCVGLAFGTSCSSGSRTVWDRNGSGFIVAAIPHWKQSYQGPGCSSSLIYYSAKPWMLKVLTLPFDLGSLPEQIAKSERFNQRMDTHPISPKTRLIARLELEGQVVEVFSRHQGWLIEDKPSLIVSYVQGGRFIVGVAAVNVPPGFENEASEDLRIVISSMQHWKVKKVPAL